VRHLGLLEPLCKGFVDKQSYSIEDGTEITLERSGSEKAQCHS
jgi:hypothetical protein